MFALIVSKGTLDSGYPNYFEILFPPNSKSNANHSMWQNDKMKFTAKQIISVQQFINMFRSQWYNFNANQFPTILSNNKFYEFFHTFYWNIDEACDLVGINIPHFNENCSLFNQYSVLKFKVSPKWLQFGISFICWKCYPNEKITIHWKFEFSSSFQPLSFSGS